VPFDPTPIAAIDIRIASEEQVSLRDAQLFVDGKSPGHPITGYCLIAQAREYGRRYHHPALPRDVARRIAKALSTPFVSEQALRALLIKEDGLREIGDPFVRFQLGKALDALLDLEATREAAE
jgi:hypothetical protein